MPVRTVARLPDELTGGDMMLMAGYTVQGMDAVTVVAVGNLESVTFTGIDSDPEVVGAPEKTPPELTVIPLRLAGGVPL